MCQEAYDRFVTRLSEEIAIVTARESSLNDVNCLIARSKAHWVWPAEYLARAMQLHRITTAYLRSNHCFEVVMLRGELVAFFSLAESDARVLIDNLWVIPEHIGRGIGTLGVRFISELARTHGWRQLWVLPDPPAEGFYKALGFLDTGERVPSRVRGGPTFSVHSITGSSRKSVGKNESATTIRSLFS